MNQRPPPRADELTPFEIERRRLLKLMAASAAMAAGACSGPPPEKIAPFVRAPEEEIPGAPLFYATSLTLSGYAMGVLVETNEGRPTKVEGNPRHPASLGATDVFAQASVLQLWDPARSQTLLHEGRIATWMQFLQAMERELSGIGRNRGEGLFILARNVCSPSLQSQFAQLRERYPQMSLHQYDPLHRDNVHRGAEMALGRPLETIYHFNRARVLLTLDADFLTGGPESVRYARDFSTLRNPDSQAMSRVYSLESMPGLIGAKADHRLARPPHEIERSARRLARALGVSPGGDAGQRAESPFEAALIRDLHRHAGECLVVPGQGMPASVHALVHALNHRLGGLGATYEYIEPVGLEPVNHVQSIQSLADALANGRVQLLVMLGGNPAYDAPADLEFASRLHSARNAVHLSDYVNETSIACTWHVPRTHDFEAWSDARAFDGVAGIVQPLIRPLYNGRSAHELLNVLLRTPSTSGYDVVRSRWLGYFGQGDAEEQWRGALRAGFIDGTRAVPVSVSPRVSALPEVGATPHALTVNFVVDSSVRDGEFANNAWLQELPRPTSKLTWDNAAYVSRRTAERLRVRDGDEIELQRSGRSIRAPVWRLPDHADDCITLPLGYGRTNAGPVGDHVGFDAYPLRTMDAQWSGEAEVKRTGGRHLLVSTQHHSHMEGRNLIRSATLAEYARNPGFATDEPEERVPRRTLYPDYPYDGPKWGMTVDLNACIGCNACTIACQAENNIPVVGKDQMRRGREMHWLRIDRYYREEAEQVRTDFQPVLCMHCERAPCEEVCPVGATVHDSQGLNLQVYNRCVGTRFCSNNCPYKVRRFNFLHYSNVSVESLKALQNPEVTVRQRGVMEKCTYCVQRIQRARIHAQQLGRRVQDGEVVTACQAVCPTQAITFGDMNDPHSAVGAAKASPRNYTLLAELNTRPRTTYLAQVVNSAADAEED